MNAVPGFESAIYVTTVKIELINYTDFHDKTKGTIR